MNANGIRPAVRIANCSGYYGDRLDAATELLAHADVDVLTGDWLAELTMAILHKDRLRDPHGGWARTFVTMLGDVLPVCVERGIKIVTNAGGLNPLACKAAVGAIAADLGLNVRVAAITGDDLIPRLAELRAMGQELHRITDREPLADDPVVANAYLGGRPIAAALTLGADIVVTGRCTDAALVIGPAMWWHGWRADQLDELAGALVAGHIIECGAQATGGNLSSFQEHGKIGVPGFPMAVIEADGTATISSGSSAGHVDLDTVTAQLLYEVGAPSYVNPDVVARLDTVRLVPGDRSVRVEGTVGAPPPATLKVSAALPGGYRNSVLVGITGLEPEQKLRELEDTFLARQDVTLFEDYTCELLGRGVDDPGAPSDAICIGRFAARSTNRHAVGRAFSSGIAELGLSSFPGFFLLNPPTDASECFRFWPSSIRAELVTARVHLDGGVHDIPAVTVDAPEPVATTLRSGPRRPLVEPTSSAPLGSIVRARSGDKGGDANLGVWTLSDPVFGWLEHYLDTDRLRELLPEVGRLPIDRHLLPNLRAINFVIHGLLGEGVSTCLRADAQAKGLGEHLLARSVEIPLRMLAEAPDRPAHCKSGANA